MSKLKKSLFGIIVLLVMTLSAGIVFATASSNQNDFMVLESGEVLEETGFFAGENVKIDGTVDGTVFATGGEVRIGGTINGDLFVAAQNVYIDGVVTGNIYGSGMNVSLGGKIERDVFIAGQNMKVESGLESGRDLFMAGQTIDYNGRIGRNLFAGGSDISINGIIGQNANIEAENLKIQDNAEIDGDLLYKSAREANIAPNASIAGKTDWEYTEMERKTESMSSAFISNLLSILSALLIWFLVTVWRPGFWNRTTAKIDKEPLKVIGVGLLALIITPILAVLFMVTIVGIPLGIITGIVYGVSIYLSKIIVAVFIGKWIANRFKLPEIHRGVWLSLLGLVILAILSIPQIPVLGMIVGFITVCLGLGSLILSNYRVTDRQE